MPGLARKMAGRLAAAGFTRATVGAAPVQAALTKVSYIDADGNPIAVAIAKLLHVPGPTQADPQLHGAGGAAEVIITVGSQTA